jgi:hypothetical protein
MEIKIFIGDIDEFYCDAKEGNLRWAVWASTPLQLFPGRTSKSKVVEKLLGRFETEEEAEQFAAKYANEYDPGEGKTKVIVP